MSTLDAGHVASSRWRSRSAAFGLGFGLTVTPRSTAAVEAAGRRLFGVASAVVTVARMVGMAVGLAILTAYGSTTIDRLSDQVYATPDAYLQFIPEELHGRPLRDPLVVTRSRPGPRARPPGSWSGLFLVAAAVTAVAIPPSLVLGGRPRMLTDEPAAPACGRLPEAPIPMAIRRPRATKRPTLNRSICGPASRSPVGDAPGASNEPGTLRVVRDRRRRAPGVDRRRMRWSTCRTSCASPDASVWIDLAGPSRRRWRRSARRCRSTR